MSDELSRPDCIGGIQLPSSTMPSTRLGVDGAMVPLLHKEWAEVKTLAIGTVEEPVLEGGERAVPRWNRGPTSLDWPNTRVSPG